MTVGLRRRSSRLCGVSTATLPKPRLVLACQGDGAATAERPRSRKPPGAPAAPQPVPGEAALLRAARLPGFEAPLMLTLLAFALLPLLEFDASVLGGPGADKTLAALPSDAGTACSAPVVAGALAPVAAAPPALLAAGELLPCSLRAPVSCGAKDGARLLRGGCCCCGNCCRTAPEAEVDAAAAARAAALANSRRGPRDLAFSVNCSGAVRLPSVRTCSGSWMRPRRLVRSVTCTEAVPLGGTLPVGGSALKAATHWLAWSCVTRDNQRAGSHRVRHMPAPRGHTVQ